MSMNLQVTYLLKQLETKNRKDRLENGNYVETCGNHFILLVNDDGDSSPAVITMKSTQLKKSRKWNSMMLNVKLKGKSGLFTPPSYSHFYRLKAVKEKMTKVIGMAGKLVEKNKLLMLIFIRSLKVLLKV